jgi:hypothetical protein
MTDGGLSPLVSAKACHMAKRRVGVQHSPSYAGACAPRGDFPKSKGDEKRKEGGEKGGGGGEGGRR